MPSYASTFTWLVLYCINDRVFFKHLEPCSLAVMKAGMLGLGLALVTKFKLLSISIYLHFLCHFFNLIFLILSNLKARIYKYHGRP